MKKFGLEGKKNRIASKHIFSIAGFRSSAITTFCTNRVPIKFVTSNFFFKKRYIKMVYEKYFFIVFIVLQVLLIIYNSFSCRVISMFGLNLPAVCDNLKAQLNRSVWILETKVAIARPRLLCAAESVARAMPDYCIR